MGYMINMLKDSKEIMASATSMQATYGNFGNNDGRNYRYRAGSWDNIPLDEYYTMIGNARFSFRKGLNGGVWKTEKARDSYIKWLNDSCGEVVCEPAINNNN